MKRLFSAILIILLACGLYYNASVQKAAMVVSGVMEASTVEPLFVYNVSIVTSAAKNHEADDEDGDAKTTKDAESASEDEEAYIAGFKAALLDYLGDSAIIYFRQAATEAVKNNVDLIFTTDKSSLLAAATETDTIPIVSTGVIDVQGTLRIASSNGKSWDQTTGRNITGVTARPSISNQVSLLIEATPNLQTVGFFFDAKDTDSIYQNEVFENYLDQAGIPWKEYEIPSDNSLLANDEDETENISVVPNKTVAASAKEGVNNDVISLGQNDFAAGLISASSTRTARISRFWQGGKVDISVETDAQNEAEAKGEAEAKNEAETKGEAEAKGGAEAKGKAEAKSGAEAKGGAETKSKSEAQKESDSLDQIIEYACSECNVLFIPAGSRLTADIESICDIATAAGVSTVGGDTTLGRFTLVCSYQDPFEQGYSAGKKAVSILQNQTDPGSIKVTAGNVNALKKLYNEDRAKSLDMTFPKSFSEIEQYFESYEIGSLVNRHVNSEE